MKFHKDGTLPTDGRLLVFGSNLAGRHGKGCALVACRRFGARLGVGKGLQGRSYGIPTKDERLGLLPLKVVKQYIKEFKEFAKSNREHHWFVTRVGCGLSFFEDHEIAPLFKGIPNCSFAEEWRPYLEKTK